MSIKKESKLIKRGSRQTYLNLLNTFFIKNNIRGNEMQTVLQVEKECWFCQTTLYLEDHHIFGGPRRKISEKYGLKVWLCHKHHTGSSTESVHRNYLFSLNLKEIAQRYWENNNLGTRQQFVNKFGRNYLE